MLPSIARQKTQLRLPAPWREEDGRSRANKQKIKTNYFIFPLQTLIITILKSENVNKYCY